MGVTMADLLGGAELPKDVIAWKYVHGQPLVGYKKLRQMPTHLWNIHEWYLLGSKHEQTMIVAKVAKEYYFCEDKTHINFSELFQLMNQDALNKFLISCYCV
jgi:hypothetical protein